MQNGLQSPMLIYDLPNQEVAINLGGPQVPQIGSYMRAQTFQSWVQSAFIWTKLWDLKN